MIPKGQNLPPMPACKNPHPVGAGRGAENGRPDLSEDHLTGVRAADTLRKTMKSRFSKAVVRLAVTVIAAVLWDMALARAADAPISFQFDSSMSRPVLENYLSRSTSFTELLHDDLTKPRNIRGVDPRDNMRLLLDTRAKFVGRALMVWGREKELSTFLEMAKPYAAALHKADPEIILQAAAFEIVTRGVEAVSIPEPVMHEFGQTVTNRTFHYDDMLYADGRFVNHWGGRGSVPDMSRLETRLWFYFLVTLEMGQRD